MASFSTTALFMQTKEKQMHRRYIARLFQSTAAKLSLLQNDTLKLMHKHFS